MYIIYILSIIYQSFYRLSLQQSLIFKLRQLSGYPAGTDGTVDAVDAAERDTEES
jgi:hypothetical protein